MRISRTEFESLPRFHELTAPGSDCWHLPFRLRRAFSMPEVSEYLTDSVTTGLWCYATVRTTNGEVRTIKIRSGAAPSFE